MIILPNGMTSTELSLKPDNRPFATRLSNAQSDDVVLASTTEIMLLTKHPGVFLDDKTHIEVVIDAPFEYELSWLSAAAVLPRRGWDDFIGSIRARRHFVDPDAFQTSVEKEEDIDGIDADAE